MRLIDADALSKDLAKGFTGSCGGEATLEQIVNDDTLADAIKTVEEQQTVDAEPKWIPCSERMPEEHKWIGTKRFGTTISDEVYVTFENLDGERFTEHLCFQNGKLSSSDQRKIAVFYTGSVPIAWMPLPKPYEAEREEE